MSATANAENGHLVETNSSSGQLRSEITYSHSDHSDAEQEHDRSMQDGQLSEERAASPKPPAAIQRRFHKGGKHSLIAEWKRKIFGMGPPRLGQPGSRLIHPYSPFGQFMTATSSILLIYVGVTTPVTIGFFWKQEDCSRMPTLDMDMAVDCFFMFEILYSLFVGISVQGVYRDDLLVVWNEYLRGTLLFDLCTSIPVSIIEYVSLQSCTAGKQSSKSHSLKFIRVLKPLRIFKMLKVMKTSKLVGALDILESIVRPPPLVTTMLKLFLLIFVMVHLCSCLFWLIKETYSTEEQYQFWLSQQGLGDDPSLYEKYLISAYFISTVFTTVGFGDIAAENSAERVLMILVMFTGSIIFGILIGEVQSSMAHINRFARERLRLSQELKSFLRNKETPPILERKLMRYVLQDCSSRQEYQSQVQSVSLLPEGLQEKIGQHLHQNLLNRVPVFMNIVDETKSSFLANLYMTMRVETHAKNLTVVRMSDRADRMLLIQRGTVRVDLNIDGPTLSTLNPGDSFGQYALYDDVTWQTDQGLPATFYALDFVELLALHRTDFLAVLRKAPNKIVMQIDEFAKNEKRMREKLRSLGADNIPVLRWVQLYGKVLRRVRFERTKNAGFDFAGKRESMMSVRYIHDFSLGEEQKNDSSREEKSAEMLRTIKLMVENQDRLQERLELLQTSVQTIKEESAALEKHMTDKMDQVLDELRASTFRRSASATPTVPTRSLTVLRSLASRRGEGGLQHDDRPSPLPATSEIVLKRPEVDIRIVQNHLVSEEDWVPSNQRSTDQDDREASRRRRTRKSPRAKLSPHSRQFLAQLFPEVYPNEDSSAQGRHGANGSARSTERTKSSGKQRESPPRWRREYPG